MTGDEHYQQAEQILDAIDPEEMGAQYQSYYASIAAAHAQLAVAAATAEAATLPGYGQAL